MIGFGTGASIPACTTFFTCREGACFEAESVRIDAAAVASLVEMCLAIIAAVCYSAGVQGKVGTAHSRLEGGDAGMDAEYAASNAL